jgi:hypothetical protein
MKCRLEYIVYDTERQESTSEMSEMTIKNQNISCITWEGLNYLRL